MINLVDVIELKLQVKQNGYNQLSNDLINNIINNESFDNMPKNFAVYYLTEQLANSNYYFPISDIDTLRNDLTNFLENISEILTDHLTENEQKLFKNLMFVQYLFRFYNSFSDISLVTYLEEIENILSIFEVNNINKDGNFLARESLKVGLLRLYDIMLNTNSDDNSYDIKTINLINNIRQNLEDKQELETIFYKIEVNSQ